MPWAISFRPVGAFEMGASCVPTLAAIRWGLGSRRFALIRGSIPPTEVRGETHGRYFLPRSDRGKSSSYDSTCNGKRHCLRRGYGI